MFGGGLVRGGGEARVASAAAPAVSDDEAVAGLGEVVQHFTGFRILHYGANRSGDFDGSAIVTGLVAAFAVPAALGFVFGIEAEMQERVVVRAGDHNHVAATAAVAAAGDELLAAKRETTVAAVAGFDANDDFVYKHVGLSRNAEVARIEITEVVRAPRRAIGRNYSGALMLTNLPMRPRSRNSITPVILANSVSSLPMPTLTPGLMRVPRWRTMMDPPGTNCPPKAFTPSRCAFESRPFLELPKPFLCAMTDSYTISLICTRV